MLPPIYQDADLYIHYQPERRILVVRWLGIVPFSRLREHYGALLHAAETRQIRCWLLDVRQRSDLNAARTHWISQVWLPEAAARMAPHRVYLAYLLSPLRALLLESDKELIDVSARLQRPEQPFCLQSFVDEGEALRWLCKQAGTE